MTRKWQGLYTTERERYQLKALSVDKTELRASELDPEERLRSSTGPGKFPLKLTEWAFHVNEGGTAGIYPVPLFRKD